MRIALMVISCATLFCSGVVGQVAASADAASSATRTVVCLENGPNCETRFIDGVETRGLFTTDLSLIGSLLRENGRLVVFLSVTNPKEASSRVEVGPEQVHLFRLQGKKDPLDIKRKTASDIARSAERRQRIAAALSGAGAAMSTQTATVQSNDGTYSTIQVHDSAVEARTRQESAANINSARQEGLDLMSKELKRNTLLPGQNVMGRVFFDQKIATAAYVVRLCLGDTNYEIPFLVIKR